MARRKREFLDLIRDLEASREQAGEPRETEAPPQHEPPPRAARPRPDEPRGGTARWSAKALRLTRRKPKSEPHAGQDESALPGGAQAPIGLPQTPPRRMHLEKREIIRRLEPFAPYVPLVLVLILSVPAVIWLAGKFGEFVGGSTGPVVEAREDGAAGAAGGAAEGVVAAGSGRFGVLAITYSAGRYDAATRTGERLARDFYPVPVQALEVTRGTRVWIEIYVGDRPARDDPELARLRDSLREHPLPNHPSGEPPPFQTAFICEIPAQAP